MEQSEGTRDAWLRFCERLSAGDVDSFDELVSPEARLIIGTAPGEWIEDRDRMRLGFEAEGVALEPGEPAGYEDGAMGWVADQPTFAFPDGSAMKARVTAVMREEDGVWRLVHAHFSVGVPDEEVIELQERWAS
jgi:SnoaL-like domain